MRVVEIAQFNNSVVIHFDTDDTRINAYTFASTLVGLADAAKAANTTLNAGCEIEIVVEALGPGSFRALVRAIYSSSRNLFANQVFMSLVLGVLGNYIYERTLAVDDKVTIEVKTDEVIIQKGDDRVVVPRDVYDATRRVEKNPLFVKAMTKTFEAVAADARLRILATSAWARTSWTNEGEGTAGRVLTMVLPGIGTAVSVGLTLKR